MSDTLAGTATSDDLIVEVARLRAEIVRLEERVRTLDHLAHEDPMIELPNRRGFMRELRMLVGSAHSGSEQSALLFVDIDDLKWINDTYGHKAGDDALVHAARLLTDGVRKTDCVARLGGDEFGILLKHSNKSSARETAARLRATVAASKYKCDGHLLELSLAVGLTMIETGDTPEQVLSRADRAMYEQKTAA